MTKDDELEWLGYLDSDPFTLDELPRKWREAHRDMMAEAA